MLWYTLINQLKTDKSWRTILLIFHLFDPPVQVPRPSARFVLRPYRPELFQSPDQQYRHLEEEH